LNEIKTQFWNDKAAERNLSLGNSIKHLHILTPHLMLCPVKSHIFFDLSSPKMKISSCLFIDENAKLITSSITDADETP
jgi:hypothetical protein